MGTSLSRRLTLRYSLYQLLYFAITAGTGGFAVTYLLDKGFAASQIGLILAATNIASCLVQPLLGTAADRLKGFALPKLLGGMAAFSMFCFVLVLFAGPGKLLHGILYVLGGVMLAAMPSLSNALCAYYAERKQPIRFGIGAGIGSLSYSTASLGIGYLIAWQGADRMILLALVLLAVLLVLVLRYPEVEGADSARQPVSVSQNQSSLLGFLGENRRFFLTILGVMLIAMCHAMAENYLINLFEALGGGSKNVGTALFIACLSAVPFLMVFDRIQEKAGVRNLMRLSGVLYVLKAFLLLRATAISHVYGTVLLQSCTYGFLFPSLYYYVKDTIPHQDMAKGQTVAMSLYTLGLALGSYAGGQLLSIFGLKMMLRGAMLFAAAGALIVNLTIGAGKRANTLA